MTALTRELARRSAALSFDQVPDDAVAVARLCMLDWLGVTVVGSQEPAPRILMQTLAPPAVAEGATVIGHGMKVGPRQAALINGTSSHVLDFDDVNATMIGHPSVAMLGAIFALAESLGSSGPDLICAFIAGYETACRAAAAVGPVSYLRGFHHTGTIGTLGAAAACARLLSLDTDHTATALALAATQAAGLGCMVGTMSKSFHAGKACENGLLAALLARNGFTATESAVECAKGFAATASGECDTAAALSDPPMRWHILNNLFKFDASCYMTHSTLAGIRELLVHNDFGAADITEVRVHLGELEFATCALPRPSTGLEVKFSVAHLAAMAVLGRSTIVINDDAAHDPATIALRDKVIVTGDGTSGAPTRIEVTLNDGRRLTAMRDVNTPESDLELQRQRLEQKFRIIAAPLLGASRVTTIIGAIQGSVTSLDVRTLIPDCAECAPGRTV